jgi:uncharacterized protein YndB with AHSA1/START domain
MQRQIENRIEVPGTPEQVWEAIATGPGIETWFVPASVEERVGGCVRLDMGAGMADAGRVTVYDAPSRFAYEEAWEDGVLATEFLVEAASGGTCVVRLVSTLHGDGDWDHVLKSLDEGWTVFLQVLRVHLTYFSGRRCRCTPADAMPDGVVEYEDARDRIVRHDGGVALAYSYEWEGEVRSGVRRYDYELVSAG